MFPKIKIISADKECNYRCSTSLWECWLKYSQQDFECNCAYNLEEASRHESRSRVDIIFFFSFLKGNSLPCRCRKYTTSLCCMWRECSVLSGVFLFFMLFFFSLLVYLVQVLKLWFIILYPNFQLLIARGASLNAENANGYDIFTSF